MATFKGAQRHSIYEQPINFIRVISHPFINFIFYNTNLFQIITFVHQSGGTIIIIEETWKYVQPTNIIKFIVWIMFICDSRSNTQVKSYLKSRHPSTDKRLEPICVPTWVEKRVFITSRRGFLPLHRAIFGQTDTQETVLDVCPRWNVFHTIK